ncbi:lasso peptide biosynthesis B2 protein [Saccharopolyspora karakumensis]|uniref:Lasso peptide biosynthesis B2 protein n=1 Tax=Saccharopolyspora karakumensis TaxID=2530386 RepID=A0A4V2YXZ6_9PSEU|nr:lasso peptide biosynthesis B2 protein [Saccharopolyspora karakumensis]TDD91267.1 lasso peptide biosynthesis B2 protein [Saccharopolyspora karakumensis]
MTTPSAINRPTGVPFGRRAAATFAVAVAHLLALLPPHRLRKVLSLLRCGAAPATFQHAEDARNAVCAASLACAGPRGCLPRSLATALLCRLSGAWPTWCTGARKAPPFGAHAWVEVDGHLVGEEVPDDYFSRLVVIAPCSSSTG